MTTRCKFFAKIFKKRFSNVYKVAEAQKKGLKRDERTVLSNRMMALESELFHEILTLLYNKRFRVLSIHDAIVVLDTPSNKRSTPELVQSIIHKVYRKNDLYPNVSTDYYGQDNLQRFMQDEEQLSAKAAEYRATLEQAATNGNETAQEILNDLNNGYRVICYDDENNVIAHLVNPKDLKRRK